MIGTIIKTVQPGMIWIRMEEHTTYEVVVCWQVGVPWIG